MYFVGDAMPQRVLNFEGRRRGTYHSTCKTNGLVNGQVPGTGLVNEAAAHNGRPAAATRISECAPAGTLNGTKPQCLVNGYINHGYKGKSTSRTLRKQGNKISAVSDSSAAGRVSGGDISGGISVNGATSLDTVFVPGNPDQMPRKPCLSAAVTTQRRRKKFRHKKRWETYLITALNKSVSLKCSLIHYYLPYSVQSNQYKCYKGGVGHCKLICCKCNCRQGVPWNKKIVPHCIFDRKMLKISFGANNFHFSYTVQIGAVLKKKNRETEKHKKSHT